MVKRYLSRILVTGGCGFIGSNFIRRIFECKDFSGTIINIDALTYAGNIANLFDIEKEYAGTGRYIFVHGDICDDELVRTCFSKYEIDTVVNFAAESHVDRSILGPADFIKTNILGTFNLINAAYNSWKQKDGTLKAGVHFHHISTDEVFGSLGKFGKFSEKTRYDPHSPYSASKASSDHIVQSYFHTYGMPVTISNCSNNYGPFQFPEKLIPLMILNMLEGKSLPVYGKGLNVRDWIHVSDHNDAIIRILFSGKSGATYNIGANSEKTNMEVIRSLIDTVSMMADIPKPNIEKLITFVKDRPGHDARYAIDSRKIRTELGWAPKYSFREGLQDTVRWYLGNMEWCNSVRSGEYRKWVVKQYGGN